MTAKIKDVFGKEEVLPLMGFDINSNDWRTYTAKLRSESNPYDDCDKNLEVDITPGGFKW